jgi:hypothetical protein
MTRVNQKWSEVMNRKFFAIAAVFAFALVLQAQATKTTTIEGYVIDNAVQLRMQRNQLLAIE